MALHCTPLHQTTMGNLIALLTKAWDSIANAVPQGRILMIGLDAAGKTTILYKFKLGLGDVSTIPTIGFNVESISYKNLELTIYDVGGQERLRSLWRYYYAGTTAVIWVVDSNDRERMEESAEHFHKLLCEDELKDVSFLIYANKQDLPNAMSCSEIEDVFKLSSVRGRNWFVQATTAPTGDGIHEGFDWLSKTVAKS